MYFSLFFLLRTNNIHVKKMLAKHRENVNAFLIIQCHLTAQKFVESFFFHVLIFVIFAFVSERDEFIKSTLYRRSIYFSFYFSFDSYYHIF